MMMRKMSIFISMFLFLILNRLDAQQVTVRASLDTSRITIGDQLRYTIDVSKSADVTVVFPILADTLARGVELLETYPADTVPSDDANFMHVRQSYLITSFDSGSHVIPSLPLLINFGGKQDTVGTNPLLLTVFTMPLDSANDIRDIKKPVGVPLTFREILPYLIAVVVLAGILYALFVFLRLRKKNKKVFFFQKPPEPAHVIALRLLDALKEKKLWQKNEVKLYHSNLTDIVRSYIENRFGFSAMEQTTDEILSCFSTLGYPELQGNMGFMLKLADMVKFAKGNPLPDENERCMSIAYDIVLKTKQEEPLPDENGNVEPQNN